MTRIDSTNIPRLKNQTTKPSKRSLLLESILSLGFIIATGLAINNYDKKKELEKALENQSRARTPISAYTTNGVTVITDLAGNTSSLVYDSSSGRYITPQAYMRIVEEEIRTAESNAISRARATAERQLMLEQADLSSRTNSALGL